MNNVYNNDFYKINKYFHLNYIKWFFFFNRIKRLDNIFVKISIDWIYIHMVDFNAIKYYNGLNYLTIIKFICIPNNNINFDWLLIDYN